MTALAKGLASILFAGFGVLSVILCHAGIYLSIEGSIFIFCVVFLFIIQRYRAKRLGLLVLLIFFVYALPFVHIVPYLWFDFGLENPLILWGLSVNPYMTNEAIVKLTAMLGAVGALGIAFGSSISYARIAQSYGMDEGRRAIRTMILPIWLFWVVFAVMLSWLAMPQDTLLSVNYAGSKSSLENDGFSSAWMMSYIILSFAFCDAIFEKKTVVKKIKWKFILATVAIIVVGMQLLRGDRESLTWLFALALAYYYWSASLTQKYHFKIPWKKIVAWLGLIFSVSMVLGASRHSLVGISDIPEFLNLIISLVDSGQVGFSNLLHGTWSAVLLTPLSVAGDYVSGQFEFNYGQDYLDLIMSLPPGFVADAVGYQRPINSTQGPAWEMRYGLGGTHAIVLPFMNFGMLGAFIIPAFWSYFIARIEKSVVRRVSVVSLSLLVTFAIASAHWLWYGEKYLINSLIIWSVFAFLYRISISLNKNSYA